jgi:Uma2 family endonuclease
MRWKRRATAEATDTVVFPDVAIHCAGEIGFVPASETVARVPELVIELLGRETAQRDRAPRGAKFLSYEMSGVREYYYGPDGHDAAGFHLRDGRYVPAPRDPEGFLSSPLLGAALRLVPAGLR